MSEYPNQVREQVQKQYQAAEDWTNVQLQASNALLATSTATAFDAAFKTLASVRALQNVLDQVVEDAFQAQRTLSAELRQVFEGYTTSVKNIVGAAIR